MVLELSMSFMSAWVVKYGGAVDLDFWRDWHLISGQLLVVTIATRLIALFLLPGSASWRAFMPDDAQRSGFKKMLMFYLSGGRTELPVWFAHNPFWKGLYPFYIGVLLATALTGFFYNSATTFLSSPFYKVHQVLASISLWFTLLHSVTALWHDLKGKGASISGMINGYRYFHIDRSQVPHKPSPFKGNTPPVYISPDSIKRKTDN
jgi:Ni/Fe-hydrogenase 1 B-type cytochrome subunit